MDRGSRLVSCLQTLEKVTNSGLRGGVKFGPDDLQMLRCTTAKILQYLQTQDKNQRDVIMKNSTYVDLVLTVLENAGDTCTQQNLVLVLNELIGKSQTSKRVSTFVSHGATHTLFQILVLESKEAQCSEELLYLIHQVLAKLGHKDRKFGVKARLTQALVVTLNLLKSYVSNPRFLQPIVHVLKLYSANVVNASFLGKNGAVSCLFKVLSVCARKHLSLCKYALDALALLLKSKSNSARAVGQGGVAILLTMFYDWHRVDSKNRHVSLRKSILSVLKNITNLQSGRKALMEVDGIRVLYSCCQESAECREAENIIFMASLIMRKCFPKNRLPVGSLKSPLVYSLPTSDFHVPDPGEGQVLYTGEENGYESSVDNDDDVSSDDDFDGQKGESDEDGAVDNTNSPPRQRTKEDLMGYKKFFQELYEFDIILEDEDLAPEQPIVIPTAGQDFSQGGIICPGLGAHSAVTRGSQSPGDLQPTAKRSTSFSSAPLLLGDGLDSVELFSGALRSLKLDTTRRRDMDSISDSFPVTPRSRQHYRATPHEHVFLMDSASGQDRGFMLDNTDTLFDMGQGPSAVNLKTGSSVFMLDCPPTPRNNSLSKKPVLTSSQPPKLKRKASKGTKQKEKKKSVPKPKVDDWQDFDPLKSLSVHSYSKESTSKERDASTNEDIYLDTDDLRYLAAKFENPEMFAEIAARTKSVGRFNKIAYPDMYGHVPPAVKEPLYEKRFGTQRQKIFEDIDRFINPEQTIDRTVYDLDSIIATAGSTYSHTYSNFNNRDEIRVTRQTEPTEHLKFNSQFECGNLRKAIQVRKYEYDLILNPDVNTNHHHQWFYFEVSNMEAGVKYRFNIVNCEKINSQFNFGMKPVMFSVREALEGRPQWIRTGDEVCYYKNHFVRSTQTTGGVKGKSYFTTTFTITFAHSNDVCYLAYHYPYSYSMLQYHLEKLESSYDANQIYYRKETLCETISNNDVPVLTITSYPSSYDRDGITQLKNRPYIFLSSRVHPGESNSSWVMKGTISYLLSNKASAQQLRDNYIFKVVPMLNPDGVINGTHRCSLVAEDLNRRWSSPCPKLHPTIYHTKGLLQYMQLISKAPLVFCDYHGHSRRKNVFLYGCSPSMSWMTEDVNNPGIMSNRMEDSSYKTLPRVLHNLAPSFSLNNCSFVVEKSKESTARVVVWRQIGVVRSYTMESTYCGCDQGPYRGHHVSTRELEEMGRKFCEGLVKVKSRHAKGAPTDPLTSGPDSSTDLQAYPVTSQEEELLVTNHGKMGLSTASDLDSLFSGDIGTSVINDSESVTKTTRGEELRDSVSESCSDSETEELQEEEDTEEPELNDDEESTRGYEEDADEIYDGFLGTNRVQSPTQELPF